MDKKKPLIVKYHHSNSDGDVYLTVNDKQYKYHFPYSDDIFKSTFWNNPQYKNRTKLLKAIRNYMVRDGNGKEVKQTSLFEIYKILRKKHGIN